MPKLHLNPTFQFYLICIICFSCISSSVCEDKKLLKNIDSLFEFYKEPKVSCDAHANCSSRILTLDTYCCLSKKQCCNWFEFAATYKSNSSSLESLKAPSILTILAILLLIICFLFVSYCFSILFCFCFKCGIFKRPKVVILSQLHDSESGLFTSGNNSPKHSTSTTSSATSSSSYINSNRRHHRHISPQKKHSHKKSSHHNKHRHRSTRSPTARTYSNKRPQYDSEIYVDFDSQTNESPFLIPPELNERVQERLNRTVDNQNSRNQNNNNSSSAVAPSAPLAADENEQVENSALNRRNNILEPVRTSSLTASSSSSLEFNASIQAAIEASNQDAVNNNNQTSTTSITNTITANFPYHDEKPPSYDDIIKNNNY